MPNTFHTLLSELSRALGKRRGMQIYGCIPLILYRTGICLYLAYKQLYSSLKDYTSGLSLICFSVLRGYCFGVLPVFLMYRIARLSSKGWQVTVRTSSSSRFNVLEGFVDSPTSSS